MGEMRNPYRMLVREPEGKSPLERPRHRWENNIEQSDKVGAGFVSMQLVLIVRDPLETRHRQACMNVVVITSSLAILLHDLRGN
jgi:hypothetical protein